jgi:cytochrome c
LEVFTGQENGFLGFALDPKFAENGWIYCLYSQPNFSGQSLSRFTMKGDVLDPHEREVTAALRGTAQGMLSPRGLGGVWSGWKPLLLHGRQYHPHGDSGGYAPIDERPDKAPWDAQKSAANTNSLSGKICRIRPKADGTYEIPDGNLFAEDANWTAEQIGAEQRSLTIMIEQLAARKRTEAEEERLDLLKDQLAQLSGSDP